MSADHDMRALERLVDLEPVSSGSVDARHNLTRERLRRKTGIVAWWPGPTSPHASAARVVLSHVTTHPTTKEEKTVRCGGWALAVGGVQDFFDLGRVARSVTMLDLDTDDWLRLSSRRAGRDLAFGFRAQEEVTTVDAFGRPRATVRAKPRAIDSDRMSPFDSGGVATISREESIYDTVWVNWRSTSRVDFLTNYRAFTEAGAPREKGWGVDTNMVGSSVLPTGYSHDATGIAFELFGPDGQPLTKDLHQDAVADAEVQFVIGQSPFFTWPLDAVALPPRESQDQDPAPEKDAYMIERVAPPAFPFAFPFRIQALENVYCVLRRPAVPLSQRDGGFFARLTLTGFLERGTL